MNISRQIGFHQQLWVFSNENINSHDPTIHMSFILIESPLVAEMSYYTFKSVNPFVNAPNKEWKYSHSQMKNSVVA